VSLLFLQASAKCCGSDLGCFYPLYQRGAGGFLVQARRGNPLPPFSKGDFLQYLGFIYFHNIRNPAEMAEPKINAYLTHLAVKEKVSASTQNQALSALLSSIAMC